MTYLDVNKSGTMWIYGSAVSIELYETRQQKSRSLHMHRPSSYYQYSRFATRIYFDHFQTTYFTAINFLRPIYVNSIYRTLIDFFESSIPYTYRLARKGIRKSVRASMMDVFYTLRVKLTVCRITIWYMTTTSVTSSVTFRTKC